MEKKANLICEYCNVHIKETDVKCPNCGANCTKVINEYKKQNQEKIDEETKKQKEATTKVAKAVGVGFTVHYVLFGVIFIAALGIIITTAVRMSKRSDNFFKTGEFGTTNKKEEKNVTVGINKEAKTSDYNVILNSYELYDYKSDKFPESYNTPAGYQKIAFNFTLTNNTDDELDTYFDIEISLTADDYKVESSELEKCMFCYTAAGKDKYDTIKNTEIPAKEKLTGYVGFLVPKDKKELRFKVGKKVTVTMDNPAYQG